MKSWCGVTFLAVLVLLVVSLSGWAQGTAQIDGTVQDPTGALLPGVEITAIQVSTGAVRTAVSNERGIYSLPNLPLGPYRLEATLPGFRTFVQTGIVLEVGSSPAINVTLQVGDVTQTIEVQADVAMVETRSVGLAQMMDTQRILELPLNGRNAAALVELAGGAVQVGETSANVSFQSMPLLSVAGGYSGSTGVQLDGVNHQDYFSSAGLPLPFPDALQEFRTETSGLSARVRQNTSIVAVTQSGTNAFHGGLFHFLRNDLFNARSYFAAGRSTLKRNQFGGTIGGPVVSNRAFFFGGFQGTTIRQDPADARTFVPTPAMTEGNFEEFVAAGCGPQLGAPFVGNVVDPSLLSPAAVSIARLFPVPDNPCGEVRFANHSIEDSMQFVGRLDYQHAAHHTLFGRAVISTRDEPATIDRQEGAYRMLSGGDTLERFGQTYAFGSTYTFGPSMVNSFRLALNRVRIEGSTEPLFDPVALGINFFPYVPGRAGISITGAFSGLAGGGQRLVIPTAAEVTNDLVFTRGAHQMSLGGSLGRVWVVSYTSSQSQGNFQFTGEVTGLGMADFLLGEVSLFQQNRPNQNHSQQWLGGAYATDMWRVRPRVTLHYGLRWDPYLPKWHTNNESYSFDFDRYRQGVKSTVIPGAPAGLLFPGDPGFVGKSGYESDWWRFAPRIGFAWDVQGDGSTSLRASYGVSRDMLPMLWTGNISTNAPFGSRVSIIRPEGGLDDPFLGFPGGNPFPSSWDVAPIFPPFSEYGSGPADSKAPSASTWNLSLQRDIAGIWALSASYVGSLAYHVWTANAINPGLYFPGVFNANGTCTHPDGWVLSGGTPGATCSTTGNTNSRRVFALIDPVEGQFFGNVAEFDAGATQNYHGLVVSVRRRAAGVNVNGNYTWSHCISDGDNELTRFSIGGDRTYLVPNNRRADRGECSFDRRHVINLTAVAETPQFAGPTLRMLASGWRLSGIYRVSSGAPLNVVTGARALTGTAGERPVQLMENAYLDTSGGPMTQYLNRAAFANPHPSTLGFGMPHNSYVGPGTWQLDMALSRQFRLREEQRIEVRAEGYNVTNSFRAGNPSVNHRDVNFGVIRTSRDARILQFALKYLF